MNIVNILRKAESKLVKESSRIAHQLSSIRTAIDALGGKIGRGGPRKGRKLSEAHKAKIRAGIKRAKAERLSKEKNKTK